MKEVVKQKEVASRAGVSPTTVSLVLNGLAEKYAIKKETRERVERVCEEMGYTRNYFASALRSKRENFITIIGTSQGSAIKHLRRKMLVKILRGEGYDVFTRDFYTEKDPADVLRETEKFRSDGMIIEEVHSPKVEAYLENLYDRNFPAVLIDTPPCKFFDQFRINREMVGYIGTRHLFEQGYKEVYYAIPGFVSERETTNWKLRCRYEGFKKACGDSANIKNPDDFIIGAHSRGVMSSQYFCGYEMGAELLKRKRRFPSGVMCVNDQLALGLMRRLFEEKVNIPEEVGIVGSENLPESGYSYISLTTVEFPVLEQAEKACEALIRRIGGMREKPESEELKPGLILRESSARIKNPPPEKERPPCGKPDRQSAGAEKRGNKNPVPASA